MFRLGHTVFKFQYPLVALMLLWLNINSGYWQLREFNSTLECLHALRAVMPYLLFPLGLLLCRSRPQIGGRNNPVKWLEAYGWIVLFASLLSSLPVAAFYFGVAFLANIYVPQFMLYNWREERGERVLLCVTWLVIVTYTAGIIVVTRGSLLTLGYSVTGAYSEGVGGMVMSRSSGIARFFGVTGLLAFARLWCRDSKFRLLWVPVVLASALVVWSLQSRGAMIGFAAGAAFLLLSARSSKWVYILLAVMVGFVFVAELEGTIIDKVMRQLERGQDQEQFRSMSGRTKSYKTAWKVIKKNPFLGQGNWADRLSGAGHVHNTYLQALLNGGILGFVPFIISWIVGWRLFAKLSGMRRRMDPIDKQLFIEASVIMVFFTIRSIPETTTASFSIDSMVMVPVYLYLVVLYQRLKEKSESENAA